jgi:hypothetical protein
MLSYPSSLQDHSDFPTPITPILKVSPNLIDPYYRRSTIETLGSQVLPPLSFTACHWPYPGSPAGALALCFPTGTGLLPIIRGSAGIPTLSDLSLHRALPATSARYLVTWLHHSLNATACGFGRPPLAGYDPPPCEPSRDRVGASSTHVLPHEPALCLHIQKGN